jgi:3-oxoacyl-[acyl-carrier-protein] synthase II
MVTPLGCGVDVTWKRLLEGVTGQVGSRPSTSPDLPARIACHVATAETTAAQFDPDQWMDPKDRRKVDEFIVFA